MTTQTATLSDFLLARLAEDEAAARAAISAEMAERARALLADEAHRVRLTHPPRPGLAGAMEEGAHVLARHDPARVLAQVGAMRKVVEQHAPITVHGRDWCDTCGDPYYWDQTPPEPYPCPTLRALAQVWASHPEFDPAWEVGA